MTAYARHIFDSLQSACKLAVIQEGFDLNKIRVEKWAETYHATPDEVRECFNIALNGSRKLPEETAASAPQTITQAEDEE